MKNKLVAGFMAATMMVSVMSTGVFAKELNPDSETNKAGDTQVTATVEENENKAAYVIEIPDKVDFGKYSSLRQKEMHIQPKISQYLVYKQIIWRQEVESLF